MLNLSPLRYVLTIPADIHPKKTEKLIENHITHVKIDFETNAL